MVNKLKKLIGAVIGSSIIAIILIAIISVLSIFGGGIMKLFGFDYTSVKSIIIFFIIVTIAVFPIETLALAFPKVLLSFNKITIKSAKILFIILDTMSTMFTMALVDYFMESISASDISILVISFIIALLSMKGLNE